MVISHHISSELAAQRQHDLRAEHRGLRLRWPFGRRAAEPQPEPLPPAQAQPASAGGGPGRAAELAPRPPRIVPAPTRRRAGHVRAKRRERAGV